MSTDGIRRNTNPAPPPAATPAPAPEKTAAAAKPAPATKPSLLDRLEGDVKGAANKLIGGVRNVIDDVKPKKYAEGRDGFVAFDPATGAITGGHAAGVTVREQDAAGTPMGPLFKILGHGLPGDDVSFQVGNQT